MIAMNGRKPSSAKLRSLIILTVLAAAAGITGYLADSEAGADDNPRRFYLKNAGGAVLFEHEFHSTLTEGCESCHHDILSSDDRHPCTQCHDEGFAAEDFSHAELVEIAGHDCESCHRVNEEKQIQSCRSCHPLVQEEAQGIVPCQDCHEEGFSPDMLTHDEMQDVEGHECSSCHIPSSVSDSYHHQCNRCHLADSPDVFADEKGDALCFRCHLQ
jgi:hypothetical protein